MGRLDRFAASHSALDQQINVHRTRLVFSEAIIKRVVEPLQAQVLAAAGGATIEKRAMIGATGDRRWRTTHVCTSKSN
jgi:hypothetical protein